MIMVTHQGKEHIFLDFLWKVNILHLLGITDLILKLSFSWERKIAFWRTRLHTTVLLLLYSLILCGDGFSQNLLFPPIPPSQCRHPSPPPPAPEGHHPLVWIQPITIYWLQRIFPDKPYNFPTPKINRS